MPSELPSVGSNQTWDRLRREYPGLAEIAAANPGRSARESYLREVAAERVRTGLGQLARAGRRATSGSSSGGEASEDTAYIGGSHRACSVSELADPHTPTHIRVGVRK